MNIPIRWSDNTAELSKRLKEGLNQIEATKAAAEKMARSLSGDNLIRAAHNLAAGVEKIGGAAKLTAAEQARVNTTVTKALEKYAALGQKAPDALEKLAAATKQVETPTAALTGRVIALASSIGTFLGNVAYDAVKRIGAGILDIASNGIKLAPTVSAFQSLTRSVGETSQAMLTAGRTATKGLISDLDLMQAANKGILLGLPLTSQSFSTLAQTAVVLGKAMGQGPVQSFNDLITALGRSSPLILDNLGLSVKVGEANEKYAKSVGKTVEQLTDAEKKLAFYNAAMDAAKQKVEEVGGLNLTLADRVQQAMVAFKNFTDALGVAIATSPVVNAGLGAIAESVQAAFGDNQTATVQRLIGVVNQVAIVLVDVAQAAITGASLLHRAWAGVEFLFSGLGSVIGLVALAFGKLIEGAAAVASYVPGLGGMMTGLRDRMAAFNATTAQSQQTFHAQAVAALEAAKGHGAFEDKLKTLSTTLGTVRGRMEEAANTQVSSAAIAETLTKTHQQQADALENTGKSAKDAAKEIEALHKKISDLERDGYVSSEAMQIMAAELMNVGRRSDDIERLKQTFDDLLESMRRSVASIKEIRSLWPSDVADLNKNLGGNVIPFTRTTVPTSTTAQFGQAGATSGRTFMQSFGDAMKGGFGPALSDLNRVFQSAFEGGGGIAGAVQSLATNLVAKFTAMIPVVGQFISQFSGAIVAGVKKLFGGPSQKELEGRDVVTQFESQFSSVEDMITRVGAAYVANGKTAAQAQQAIQKLWAAEKQGAEATRKALEEINAELERHDQIASEASSRFGPSKDELAQAAVDAKDVFDYMLESGQYTAEQLEKAYYAWQKAMADAGNEAAKAWIEAHDAAKKSSDDAFKSMEKDLTDLIAKRDSLAKGIAAEAPEEVMGVIETQQRAELKVLDEEIARKAEAYEKLAKDTGQEMADAVKDAFKRLQLDPLRVTVIYDTSGKPSSTTTTDSGVVGASRGARVTRDGLQLLGDGGVAFPAFRRIGTDTIPAMLTPGELVLNVAQQTRLAAALSGDRTSSTLDDARIIAELRALRSAIENMPPPVVRVDDVTVAQHRAYSNNRDGQLTSLQELVGVS